MSTDELDLMFAREPHAGFAHGWQPALPRATNPCAKRMPKWTLHTVLRWCLAMIAAVTAVIHFAVAGEHFREYWLFGVFMLVAAWSQLAFALASLAKPTAATWWGGAVGNALIVSVYVVTRTVGDVIGPTPSSVESMGFGDLACTVAEVLVVVGCAWLLLSKASRPVAPRLAISSCTGMAVFAATVLSIALVGGRPDMVMPMHPNASTSRPLASLELSVPRSAGPSALSSARPSGHQLA